MSLFPKPAKGERVYHCRACAAELALAHPPGRRDTCPGCGVDLRCCLNCALYDPGYANACREPNAERVVEKDRGNFCEYFALREEAAGRAAPVEGTRARLEALFKKH